MAVARLSNARLVFLLISEVNELTLVTLHPQRSKGPTNLAKEFWAGHRLTLNQSQRRIPAWSPKTGVFDFPEPPPWLPDMKINSSPLSNGPDGKELNTLLKAINRQMDKSSFKNYNCFPVPISLSVEDYVDDLFSNPGEESECMQGSTHGDAELILESSTMMKMIQCWMSWPLSPSPHPVSMRWWQLVPPRQTQTIRTSCASEWCCAASGVEVQDQWPLAPFLERLALLWIRNLWKVVNVDIWHCTHLAFTFS